MAPWPGHPGWHAPCSSGRGRVCDVAQTRYGEGGGEMATVDDPLVYTRPFTIAFMLMRHTTKALEIWEDSCFEGNRDVEVLYSIGLTKDPGITSEDVPAVKARTPAPR